MSSSAELHLAYKVANAAINPFPYPHFYVTDAFPSDYYDALQANLPDPAAMLPIQEVRPVKGYEERFVLEFSGEQFAALPASKRAFWGDLHRWLVGGRFGQLLASKFGHLIDQRFGRDPNLELTDEALLVQDVTHYSLGPHTDTPRKIITLLFYLPKDESQRHLGTSIYVPKDESFRCPGGPHHRHEMFERMWTLPFVPNSLFVFFKNDVSFHGVEPVKDPDCRRWLLLYDIYLAKSSATAPAPPQPALKFSF
jgi:hypothetical protein